MTSQNSFNSFIGNRRVVSALKTALEAACKRNMALTHTLLSGPSGTGKTTLAKIVAEASGGQLHRIHAPSLSKNTDLSVHLIGMSEKDVLFIDEIHALSRESSETLFEAMEESQVTIIVPDGNSKVANGSRSLTIPLPSICIIGATTDPNKLTEAFFNRFKRRFRLEEYTVEELVQILELEDNHDIPRSGLIAIAQRSRGRAREALNIFGVVCDHVLVQGHWSDNLLATAFSELGLGEYGDTIEDRLYLDTLIHKLKGGPVGLNALVSATGFERSVIEEVIEPFLLQRGFIEKTPRGRVALKDYRRDL